MKSINNENESLEKEKLCIKNKRTNMTTTTGYAKIENLIDNECVSKEALFDELMKWLPDDKISKFADDYKRLCL